MMNKKYLLMMVLLFLIGNADLVRAKSAGECGVVSRQA